MKHPRLRTCAPSPAKSASKPAFTALEWPALFPSIKQARMAKALQYLNDLAGFVETLHGRRHRRRVAAAGGGPGGGWGSLRGAGRCRAFVQWHKLQRQYSLTHT
jgi:hypothetical protein